MRGLWLISVVLLAAGCGTSRWAMDDSDYAAKYSKPYGKDKIPRMAKQAVDARHVGGKGGFYLGAAGQSSPFTAGAEIGGACYWSSCCSGHAGLVGVAGAGADNLFGGADVGLRVQPPTRLAPFVGIGAMGGISAFKERDDEIVDDDYNDNDDDGIVDEPGETTHEREALAAVYPEIGVHFWLNGLTRLTASGRYLVTSDGRENDFWYYGLTLAFLGG
jgi:hypothetical protein